MRIKIFSNFDTTFKDELYKEYVKKYGKDKVILITRHKIYLIFYVILPAIIFLFSNIILLYIGFVRDWGEFNGRKWGIIVFIMFILFFRFFVKVIKKLIDYYMDFAIITPKEIIAYNQTGIFSRSSRSVDVDKIKTISIDKKGILKSLFNFGDIIFLSEGDESGHGDIKLQYVHDPDKVRERIINIIEFGEGE